MALSRLSVIAFLFASCLANCNQSQSCLSAIAQSIATQSNSPDNITCAERYSTAIYKSGKNESNACVLQGDRDKFTRADYLLPGWVDCYAAIYANNVTQQLDETCDISDRSGERVDLPSTIPVIVLRTAGVPIPMRSRDEDGIVACEVLIFYANATQPSEVYNAGVKLHGQSSSTEFPKHGYAIETLDDEKLLQFHSHDKWILKGPYADMTLMRDSLAFELSRRMGEYAPRTMFVELYLVENLTFTVNYTEHYQGVFVLEEKIERGKHRVDIAKSDGTRPPQFSGYMLKVDKIDQGDNRFVINTSHTSTNVTIAYPSKSKITVNQTDYITQYVRQFEKLLFSRNWLGIYNSSSSTSNSNFSTSYRDWINRSSFIDYLLLTELVRSADSYWVSTYFTVSAVKEQETSHAVAQKQGVIHMGPAWDYDLAFGNTGDVVDPPPCTDPGCPQCEACLTEGWQFDVLLQHGKRPHGIAPWFNRMLADAWFRTAVIARWRSLRNSTLSDSVLNSTIDNYQLNLSSGAQQRNFVKWPTLGTRVWPFPNDKHQLTYELEVEVLRSWLVRRAHWVDANMEQIPHEEFYGPGSTCDKTNHCGAGTVRADFEEDACSAPSSKPNSWNYYDNWQFSQCPNKMTSLNNSWPNNQAYLSTGGNGSSCSLQTFLFFKDNSCPHPLACYAATTDYPIASCQPPGWTPPPPTLSPTVSPTLSPTTVSPTHSPSTSPTTFGTPPTTHAPTRVHTKAPTAPTTAPSGTLEQDTEAADSGDSLTTLLIGGGSVVVFLIVGAICYRCRRRSGKDETKNILSMQLLENDGLNRRNSLSSSRHNNNNNRKQSNKKNNKQTRRELSPSPPPPRRRESNRDNKTTNNRDLAPAPFSSRRQTNNNNAYNDIENPSRRPTAKRRDASPSPPSHSPSHRPNKNNDNKRDASPSPPSHSPPARRTRDNNNNNKRGSSPFPSSHSPSFHDDNNTRDDVFPSSFSLGHENKRDVSPSPPPSPLRQSDVNLRSSSSYPAYNNGRDASLSPARHIGDNKNNNSNRDVSPSPSLSPSRRSSNNDNKNNNNNNSREASPSPSPSRSPSRPRDIRIDSLSNESDEDVHQDRQRR